MKDELADEVPACPKCGNEAGVAVLCRSCREERSDVMVTGKDGRNPAQRKMQPAVAALQELLQKLSPPSESNCSSSPERKQNYCMSPSLESTSTAVPTSPSTPVPMTSQNKLLENLCCPSCGRDCTEDTRFCRHCGRRLIEDLRDSLLWKASGLPAGPLPRQVISSPIDSVWKRASASPPVSQSPPLPVHSSFHTPERRPVSPPPRSPSRQPGHTSPRHLARAWLVQEPVTPASGSLQPSLVSSPSRHLGLTPPENLLAAIGGFPAIAQGTLDSVGSLSEIRWTF